MKNVALRVALAAAALRVVGAIAIRLLGFSVVSDDDFARVVIAQRFAASPRLDPTGTSWLPLPFWLVGSAMKLFGSTLALARVMAVLGAAFGGALVAAMAVAVGLRPRRALAASALAAAMPWAMQLAVATVPEAPAAACAAAGAIALASMSSRVRLVGAFALLASTWSRYDAWPIAFAFAAITLADLRRTEATARREMILAAIVAVFGPIAWTLWQAAVYGDAFRYLRLVRSYRQALGAGPSLRDRVLGYPLGIVEEMREVLGAGLVGLVAWRIARKRDGEHLHVDFRRPLLLAALQLALLIAGDVRDGAPTHHPERALLGPATIVIFASAEAVGALLASTATSARRILLGALATVALASWIGVRLHRSLRWYASAPRLREVAAGAALARSVPRGSHVLIDTRDLPGGAIDYGYYALLAAFGRPAEATIDRDQDPRKPKVSSSFDDAARLRLRIAETGARALFTWGPARRGLAESQGARVVDVEQQAGTTGEQPWAILLLDAR